MLKLCLTVILAISLQGCSVVVEGAAWAIAESMKPNHSEKFLVKTQSGDSIVLEEYQIDGDTLFGNKEDYSEYKIAYAKVTKIENYTESRRANRKEQGNRKKNENQIEEDSVRNERIAKHFKKTGIFAACLFTGMTIGGGIGYVIPLTEETNSSNPGTNSFLSTMTGMALGGIVGVMVYLGIRDDL